ncbi:unnamed protein product, partial [Polarella glacialis]
ARAHVSFAPPFVRCVQQFPVRFWRPPWEAKVFASAQRMEGEDWTSFFEETGAEPVIGERRRGSEEALTEAALVVAGSLHSGANLVALMPSEKDNRPRRADAGVNVDVDFVQLAKQHAKTLERLGSKIHVDDAWEVLEKLAKTHKALSHCGDELLTDKGFVLAAVDITATQLSVMTLDYVATEMREDREVLLSATRKSAFALRFAPTALLAAIASDAFALKHAAPALRADRQLVLAAVQRDGCALEFAAEKLQRDREVVRKAVQQNGNALRFAGQTFLEDEDFLLEAIARTGGAVLKYVPFELYHDMDFLRKAIGRNCSALSFAPKELQGQPELVLAAIAAGRRTDGAAALQLAPAALREDRQFLLQACKLTPQALRVAPEKLRADRGFVLEMLKIRGAALEFAPEDLRGDREFVLAAVQQDLGALCFADAEIRNDLLFETRQQFQQQQQLQ